MNWLLKIVEGPMKGAEVALVNGMRVKVGSSPDSDIVIADSTLGPVAFELDVSESGVTAVGADGEARPMNAFEIRDVGTSAFAVGPAEGAWQELVRPAPAAEAPAEAEASAASEDAKPSEPPAEERPESEGEPSEKPAEEEKPARRRSRGLGCLFVLLVLLLFAFVLWLLGRYCGPVRPYYEKAVGMAAPCVTWTKARCADAWTWCVAKCGGSRGDGASGRSARTVVPLDEIAKEHGLKLSETDGAPLLSGNLRRRTERLAIRALALASDAAVRFDLTDDETLRASSDELLFACTDGALKAVSASNRTVTVTGYAPTVLALEKAIRALNADVRGIEKLDTAGVAVGGTPPKGLADSAFAKSATPEKAAPDRLPKPRLDFPIAGILTEPYPCVVMRDGLRLIEGAQIGTAILEKIESDKLTLRDGARTFEWKP